MYTPGYDRPPPPPYYDLDYDDRYADRHYIPRDFNREFDSGGSGRRPTIGGVLNVGYPPYETPYNNRPYGGSSINPIPPDVIGGAGAPVPPVPPSPSHAGSLSGTARPPVTRCEESDNFKQIAARHKMRRHFVRRALIVPSLNQCERECIESRDFVCRSFNYRYVLTIISLLLK